MKNLYLLLSLFLVSFMYSQVPQAFTYQTIAFNSAGAPVANGSVKLRISILENSATGTVLYTETHTKTTNSKGLVNLNIGQGTATTGSFATINWGTNTKFVKVEMDPTGGNNFTNVGVNQLMSVPYSQVSKTVVTGPGQGITLVSPSGTPYVLNVNDAGVLNLPFSSAPSATDYPTYLFMYGSYNNYNPANAEILRNRNENERIGFKYLAANAEYKFISSKNNGEVYGVDGGDNIIKNGLESYNISSGFYLINLYRTASNKKFTLYTSQIKPVVHLSYFQKDFYPTSYNPNTNTFTYSVTVPTGTGVGPGDTMTFQIQDSYDFSHVYGDELLDGTIDPYSAYNGIRLNSAGNYKVELILNFNGSGTYTVTKL